MKLRFVFTTLLLLLCIKQEIVANSTGAGGCIAGNMAGGTYHTISGGELSAYGVTVSVGGIDLTSGQTFEIPSNSNVEITARGLYKGLFIRLQAADGTTDLFSKFTPKDTVLFQVNTKYCVAPIGSITHKTPGAKLTGTGILDTTGVLGSITMDVTIVANGKLYYYSGYTLSVVPPPPTTPAPVTPAPVTPAPVTPAPVPAPTTPAPVPKPTTPAPVAAPTTPAPVAAPTTPAPVTKPTTPVPVTTPTTPAPVATPTTPAPVATPTTSSPQAPITQSPVKSVRKPRRKPTSN